MGGAYAISRKTAEKLSRCTGQLWEDTAGKWGASEQMLALKAFLLNVPVYVVGDIRAYHLYRKINKVPDSVAETFRNSCRGCRVAFSDPIYNFFFRPIFIEKLGLSEVIQIERDVDVVRPWSLEDEERLILMLFGKNPSLTDIHPNNEWIEELCKTLSGLPENASIFQWRPGPSTYFVKKCLPKANLICVDMPGHRMKLWETIAKYNDFEVRTPLVKEDEYVTYPVLLDNMFDLAIVGGERQKECRLYAQAAARQVVVNELADAELIEPRDRINEVKRLETPKPDPVFIKRKEHPKATVLLLNWARQENLPEILTILADTHRTTG